MDASGKELLISAGVNLTDAFERFMNNEKLYENYLRRFATNSDFQNLAAAFAASDWENALAISHNLKGVSGSLGFTQLYELLCSQVSLLRQDDNPAAAALMDEILPEYTRLLEVTKQVLPQ